MKDRDFAHKSQRRFLHPGATLFLPPFRSATTPSQLWIANHSAASPKDSAPRSTSKFSVSPHSSFASKPLAAPARQLLLIRLLQQGPTGSVERRHDHRFLRLCANFKSTLRMKRLVRKIWQPVAGPMVSFEIANPMSQRPTDPTIRNFRDVTAK
ncbi:MAG: hypothetical protein DMG12_12565 [Acidobacteria bacterium]|nr:MAG: hypothetical protein DMG12_12565 [Acidobacteriota bacterium]